MATANVRQMTREFIVFPDPPEILARLGWPPTLPFSIAIHFGNPRTTLMSAYFTDPR